MTHIQRAIGPKRLKQYGLFQCYITTAKGVLLVKFIEPLCTNGMHGSVREGISQVRKIPSTRLGSMQNLKSL